MFYVTDILFCKKRIYKVENKLHLLWPTILGSHCLIDERLFSAGVWPQVLFTAWGGNVSDGNWWGAEGACRKAGAHLLGQLLCRMSAMGMRALCYQNTHSFSFFLRRTLNLDCMWHCLTFSCLKYFYNALSSKPNTCTAGLDLWFSVCPMAGPQMRACGHQDSKVPWPCFLWASSLVGRKKNILEKQNERCR